VLQEIAQILVPFETGKFPTVKHPIVEDRLHLVLRMTQRLDRNHRDRYVRMLFRQLPGAVWTTDRNLCLTYIAGRLANDMTPRAKPGMQIFDILGSNDPTHPVIACHRAALSGESQSFAYQHGGRWYAIFIEQLTDDNGAVAGCIAAAFDVTEQRATQERLARSEALLAQAQRVAHVGSFEWEIAANVVTWSDELHRIYGLEPGQFGGTYEAFLERLHPDDREQTISMIFDAVRKGSRIGGEHRIVRTDGSVRVLHTQGDVITDKDGHAVRVAGCCWDVTELRDAMDNLERARSLLEATIEATADGILVMDRDGKPTIYNQRFLSLWRIPGDLAWQHDHEKLLVHVCDQLDDPDRFLCSTRELYSHPERESFDVQYFKDGRVFERYSTPQRIGEQIAGRVWSFRDVTDRERLLRRTLFLADAGRLLSSLDVEPALDSVAHLAVPFMGDGCAIDLLGNGQPRRLLLVSREGTESFSPELHSAVMAGHSTIYFTGTRSCMAVPLVVKGAVAGAMTFIGSRTRRYKEQDLQLAETLARRAALSVENARLYRKAQEAVQARDEFLAIAAHEIRGPITALHLAVQGLQKGKVRPEATPKVLEIIEREDRRLARFVDELLDLGRIQSGQIYFNFEKVDLGQVVREAASVLAAELAKSGSPLSITTGGRPVGQWDKFRLHQVATNLLSNAIKFGQGKPIAIAVTEHQGLTTLEVKDQGIGIAPEMLDRIFKPFERAVSVRNYGGLGLGLFIVRTIVEGLGGTVRVVSQPKTGSTFTVELRDVSRP
jgi:PAS domain S-box-containing protein